MTFPALSNEFCSNGSSSQRKKVRMVLDTDTYNEIDDQFALVYALLCPEKLNVEAVFMQPCLPMTGPPGPATGWRRAMKKSCACWNGCTWTRRDLFTAAPPTT